jgi:ABC-type nitrate/sulfonate/bicarbonate transport system substrate-binding protein
MITRARALAGIGAGIATVAFPNVARSATTSLSAGQVGATSIAFFPLFVAQKQGFFKDAGLDVSITNFNSGAVVGAAMTSGSIDVGNSLMTDVFALRKAGRSAKVTGALVNGYYVDVIAANQFLAAAKISRSSALRARVEALRGKKIGITGPGSGTEALLVYLFKRAGMDTTRDATLVNVGTDQAAIVQALKSGRIDAVSFAWPLSMVAEAEGVAKPLISPAGGDVPSMRGQVHGVMYASEATLGKKQQPVVEFVKAIARAEAFIHRDRNAASNLLKEYDKQLDDKIIAALAAAYYPVLPQTPAISRDAYERALNFHRFTGYAAPSDNAYADIVDANVIQLALKR